MFCCIITMRQDHFSKGRVSIKLFLALLWTSLPVILYKTTQLSGHSSLIPGSIKTADSGTNSTHSWSSTLKLLFPIAETLFYKMLEGRLLFFGQNPCQISSRQKDLRASFYFFKSPPVPLSFSIPITWLFFKGFKIILLLSYRRSLYIMNSSFFCYSVN